jgi:ribonuclease Z
MFELVFLGTSASAPSIHRGLTATAILAGEHRFLIDCGEGTQRQILRSGIGFKRLNRILLTHGHLDHILGLGGLMSTFARWESIEKVEILGGRGTLDRVRTLLFDVVLGYEKLDIDIKLYELRPGPLMETKDFTLIAFPVTHRGPGCFGFSFEETSRRPFLAEKADALGVPAGPERGRLVAGQPVTLANGRVVTPDMVLGERVAGAKLVYVGDTGRTDNLRDHVRDANTLVIEATFLEDETETARQFGHLTARQAAELAAECNVGSLILNHVSRRYRESAILAEARRYFPNAYVARDLDHFAIKRGLPVTKITLERPGVHAEPEAETSAAAMDTDDEL